jgi:DNA-binding PadR family transcriptional regulator
MSEDYPEGIKEGIITVKSSRTREKILEQLEKKGDLTRPKDIIEPVRNQADTSEGNFYEAIRILNQNGLLEKTDGDGRATLYTVTELGSEVYSEIETESEELSEVSETLIDSKDGYRADRFLENAQNIIHFLDNGEPETAKELLEINYEEHEEEYGVLERFTETYEEL